MLRLYNMKAAQLFVKALENEGVDTIFALPGEENLYLLDTISKSSIRLILTRHEQAAGFMAANYGRLSGKPGVVLTTLGPGATNLLTPISYAKLAGFPLVVLTAQKDLITREQGNFQYLEIDSIFSQLCKYSEKVESTQLIPTFIRNCFKFANSPRKGVSLLELPENLFQSETESNDEPLKVVNTLSVPHFSEIDKLITAILNSKNPLLIFGGSAKEKELSLELTKFINQFHFKFITTQMGKGAVDERNPYYLGTPFLSRGEEIHSKIEESDLIVTVGYDLYEKPVTFFQNPAQKIISISPYLTESNKTFSPDIEIVGDLKTTFQILLKVLETKDYILPFRRSKFESEIESDLKNNLFTIKELALNLQKQITEDGILALDNGLYKLDFAKYYKAYSYNSYLVDNNLATMGAGLPSAIAAKLLYPKREVIALCGDGGFMMNSQELESAVRLNLQITIIVLTDGAYGMVKAKQADKKLHSFGLDFGNPQFDKFAQSFGANGFKANNLLKLNNALKESRSLSGPTLIELPITYPIEIVRTEVNL